MEIEAIKQIIEDQNRDLESKFKKERIISRTGLDYARTFLKHPNILAILGVRRSGKSIFSLLLSKQLIKQISYINFDDERLIGVKTEDFNKILQAFYELNGDADLIILDEIQNTEGWELFINRLRGTKKIIITGSNSRMLSGELATHLTGRYIDFTLFPFSFKEMLGFAPNIYLTEDVAKVRNQLNRYIQGSGFPEFIKFGPTMISKIYSDIINKDCIRRYKINEEKAFKELAHYLISNFSCEFTYSKLSNVFGIKDAHTIKNYVSYLQDAFIIIVLERFSPKLKQQIIAPRKVYAIDQGFCNFIGFKLSKNVGKVYENVVCVELLRRKAFNLDSEVYYWKNVAQEEIDFVVKKGLKVKQLIQVCYEIDDYDTKKRELRALLKGSKELRCNNLLVITSDKEGEEIVDAKKIKYVPLWKWLLE